jgi:hypothetical protein
MDGWLKCRSLKRKTHDNPSESSVVENSASADEVPSLKKSSKYCPSYLQMGFSVLNKDGEDRPQCSLLRSVIEYEAVDVETSS